MHEECKLIKWQNFLQLHRCSLLTFRVSLDSPHSVWIARQFRDSHLRYLINNNTPVYIYCSSISLIVVTSCNTRPLDVAKRRLQHLHSHPRLSFCSHSNGICPASVLMPTAFAPACPSRRVRMNLYTKFISNQQWWKQMQAHVPLYPYLY